MSMTLEEMEKAFEEALDSRPMSNLCDFDGFMRLRQLGYDKGKDLVACAEHDEIWLSVNCEWLAETVTIDDVNYLVDCGIHYDSSTESMHMFV